MKRPISAWLLILWFGWSLIATILDLLRYEESIAHPLFADRGLGSFYFALMGLYALLAFATIVFLLQPVPLGFWTGIAGSLISTAGSVLMLVIAYNDRYLFRTVLEAHAAARGREPAEAFLDVMSSPNIIVAMGAAGVFLACVELALLIWAYPYFRGTVGAVPPPIPVGPTPTLTLR